MFELKVLTVFVALAVLAAQSGCVRSGVPSLPPPPSEDTRSKFGRMGVTWVSEGSPPALALPAAGSCEGAGRGAVLGICIGVVLVGELAVNTKGGGGGGNGGLAFAAAICVFLVVSLAIIPLAILIGSAYGASAAHPAEEVEAAVFAVSRAASDPSVPRGIARRILERGRARTDEDLTWLEPGAPPGRCDSVLEVGPIAVALAGPYQINPLLRLVASFPVRVIRVSDGAILYAGTWGWQAPGEAELFGWAAGEGSRIRGVLEEEGRRFSERVVDQLFLLHLLPTDREWKEAGKP
jgi:hypothetical protein